MRELTQRAKDDVIKLYGGAAWLEVIEIKLPDYFIPTDKEKEFLSLSPDGKWHILITNVQNYDYVVLPAANWQTEGLPANYKCFFGVPYERDDVEDSNASQGQMNSRLTLGDTGETVKKIVDRADGLYGCEVKVGFTMQNEDSLLEKIEVYEPEVVLDFTVSQVMHDTVNFACILSSDTPLEWKFPARTMLKNVCHFQFKGLECGFTGDIVQKVMSSRKGGGITDVFNGHWAINGGFIEKLNPDGSNVMENVAAFSKSNYIYIESKASDYFYALRDSDNYFAYFDGTNITVFNISNERAIKHEDYPFERTISSGGFGNAYAITNTATTRYLYRFSGTTRTRIGSTTAWQYFNMVSSPAIDLCFAIQGGTYSGTTFTASNQTVGRLIKVEGTSTSVTDLYPGKRWKWVSSLAEGYIFAIDEDDCLYHTTQAALSLSQVADFETGNPVQVTEERNNKNTGFDYGFSELVYIDNGNAYACYGGSIIKKNTTENWFLVAQGAKGDSWDRGVVLLAESGLFCYEDIPFIIDPDFYNMNSELKGNVKTILPIPIGSRAEPKFYYVAGGEIHLYEHKDFKTCNHTLTDCKERGNEVRFGGFPGIGSGGLTK